MTSFVRKAAWAAIISASLMNFASASEALAAAAPSVEFRADGEIASSAARLTMRKSGVIALTTNAGDTYDIHLSFSWRKTNRWFTASHLKDAAVKIDAGNRAVVFSGVLPQGEDAAGTPAAEKPIGVEFRMVLTDENKARVTLSFDTDTPIEKSLSLADIRIHSPRSTLVGQSIQADGQTFLLTAEPPADKSKPLGRGKLHQVILSGAESDRRVIVTPIQSGEVFVNDINLASRNPVVEVGFHPAQNKIIFDVELPAGVPASGETHAGIDFYATGKLRMPRYQLSRNLVQNPGFEQGLRYWGYGPLGKMTDSRLGDYYSVTTENPQSGRYCLKILGEAGQQPASANTFAIPVEPGADYTVSFYARSEKPGSYISLSSVSAIWPKFPVGKSFPLTTTWQRFSANFRAPNGAVSVGFSVNNPQQDCVAYVDSVQLEKNTSASEYVAPAVESSVVTQHDNNMFQPGETIGAMLNIRGPADGKGKAAIRVTDFFDREVIAESHAITLDGKGLASMNLPWQSQLVRGQYLIEITITLADGTTSREFDRVTILPYLNNTHAQKNLFSMGATDARQGSWVRRWDFWRKMGIGSAIHFDPQPHGYFKIMADNNALNYTSIFDGGESFKAYKLDIKDHFHMTTEQLDLVERAAYEKAAAYPEIRYWKLLNEPGSAYIDNLDEMKTLIGVFDRARKGILRANPSAKIISPDPANMYSNNGIKYLDTFYRAGGAAITDIPAIHPYRPRPEEPSLDADTATLLAMLDRNKVSGDVWFTEGIYHQNFIVPAYGLNAHRGCSSDEYRCGPLSYDIGWGEKICAAYTARSWLVGLKYSDRVKVYVDWGYPRNSYLDVVYTPTSSVFASNTLGNLLGNATFSRDLKLGQDIYCYVFQDQEKRPIAVIWTSQMEVDMGRKQGPMLKLAAVPAGMELIDLMGKTDAKPAAEVAVSSFPIFLRGKAGSEDSLVAAITGGRFLGDDMAAFRTYLQMRSSTQAEACLQNMTSRPLSGKLRILRDATPLFDDQVTVNVGENWSHRLDVSSGRGLNSAKFQFEFTPKGEQKPSVVQQNLEWIVAHKMKSAPVMNGNLMSWQPFEITIPPRRLDWSPISREEREKYPNPIAWAGADDLSAQYFVGWNDDSLAIAVKVKDQILAPSDSAKSAWRGDSLQIYVDGWGDARRRGTAGFANDDQAFSVWPGPQGLEILRDVAPEQQLAFLRVGPVSSAKRAFARTSDGYSIYQMILPKQEIQPVDLKKGTVFGFAILVNDNDGDYRKRSLTMTPAGTEPHMRPDLYPFVILED